MTIRLRAAYVAAALLSSAALAADPVSFRGVPMGATKAEFMAAQPDFECYTERCYLRRSTATLSSPGCMPLPEPDRRMCLEAGTNRERKRMEFAGVYSSSMTTTFYDERLGSALVSLPAASFETIAAAMREKFGAATEERHPEWKNRAGTVLQNTVLFWRVADTSIEVTRYGSTVDESSVSYMTDSAAAISAERAAAKAKAGAKSL